MFPYSRRVTKLIDSPIRTLASISDQVKRNGTHVYHLNIGQPDLPTPPAFLEAILAAKVDVVRYSPSHGERFLREAVSQHYNQFYQTALGEEHVFVTCGSSEALLFTFFACTDEGEEILVLDPCYTNYIGYAEMIGTKLSCVTSYIETAYRLPPIEAFEEKITRNTKAILLCNPNNPTGYLYTKDELLAIGNLCEKHQLLLIVDEAYRGLCYSGTPSTALQTLAHLGDRVVVLDTVSKQYSATGARIGFIVTKNVGLLAHVMKLAHMRLSPPFLEQIGAKALLELPAHYYQDICRLYQKRRDLALEKLQSIEGVVCPKPEGAFYLACALPVEDASAFCKWMLETFRKDNATVMLTPMHGFYQAPHIGKHQVRIAYVLNEQDLDKAIDCLRAGLDAYQQLHNAH